MYRKISNISSTKSQNLNVSHLVVGAAPTVDARTTSEWSTILLWTDMRFISEVLLYLLIHAGINVNLCW